MLIKKCGGGHCILHPKSGRVRANKHQDLHLVTECVKRDGSNCKKPITVKW